MSLILSRRSRTQNRRPSRRGDGEGGGLLLDHSG